MDTTLRKAVGKSRYGRHHRDVTQSTQSGGPPSVPTARRYLGRLVQLPEHQIRPPSRSAKGLYSTSAPAATPSGWRCGGPWLEEILLAPVPHRQVVPTVDERRHVLSEIADGVARYECRTLPHVSRPAEAQRRAARTCPDDPEQRSPQRSGENAARRANHRSLVAPRPRHWSRSGTGHDCACGTRE